MVLWFLSVLQALRDICELSVVDPTSITKAWREGHVIVIICLIFTLEGKLNWVNVGGGVTYWYQSMVQILRVDGIDACSYACIVMLMVIVREVIV